MGVLVAGGLLLAACGSTSGQSSSTTSPSTTGAAAALTNVTVEAGLIPVTDVAAIYLGIQEGFFKKNGITLKLNMAATGAALVPAVMSGQYAFGFSAVPILMQARDQGLPVKLLAVGSYSTGVAGKDVTMIHASPTSGIKSAKDLVGKTVAVSALNSFLQMLGEIAVQKAGGDPSKVNWVQVPLPNMVAALQSGRVQAMVGAEPFGTAAIAAGFPPISSPYETMSSSPIMTSAYFTSEAQIAKNPQLFKQLRAAINESLTYAQGNPSAVRAQLGKFTTLPPSVAASLILPSYLPTISQSSIELWSTYSKQYGLIKNPVSYSSLVWQPTS